MTIFVEMHCIFRVSLKAFVACSMLAKDRIQDGIRAKSQEGVASGSG